MINCANCGSDNLVTEFTYNSNICFYIKCEDCGLIEYPPSREEMMEDDAMYLGEVDYE